MNFKEENTKLELAIKIFLTVAYETCEGKKNPLTKEEEEFLQHYVLLRDQFLSDSEEFDNFAIEFILRSEKKGERFKETVKKLEKKKNCMLRNMQESLRPFLTILLKEGDIEPFLSRGIIPSQYLRGYKFEYKQLHDGE